MKALSSLWLGSVFFGGCDIQGFAGGSAGLFSPDVWWVYGVGALQVEGEDVFFVLNEFEA